MKRRILVTAGPTREMLDPVRFISNLSTGEMGYALARIAYFKKHSVTLISGPTALKPPSGVRFIPVVSAQEMKRACEQYFPRHDVLIMTAAVCDFTPQKKHRQKISRTKTKQFLLKRTPDIIAGLAQNKGKRLAIGFCLETHHWLENAVRKIKQKRLDGIVANYYAANHYPFGRKRITTALINQKGEIKILRSLSKRQIASRLLNWIESLTKERGLNRIRR